jgi:hypothetical protein
LAALKRQIHFGFFANIGALMKRSIALLTASLMTLGLSSCGYDRDADRAPGHYEHSTRSVDSSGTERKETKSTDVGYDDEGNKKEVTKTKTSTDPEGLFNKTTTTTTDTETEQSQ